MERKKRKALEINDLQNVTEVRKTNVDDDNSSDTDSEASLPDILRNRKERIIRHKEVHRGLGLRVQDDEWPSENVEEMLVPLTAETWLVEKTQGRMVSKFVSADALYVWTSHTNLFLVWQPNQKVMKEGLRLEMKFYKS